MSFTGTITLNHYQLKTLFDYSEENWGHFDSVILMYRSGEDCLAYAGPGLYTRTDVDDLEHTLYLACDSQDNDRAIQIAKNKFEQEVREYAEIEESEWRSGTAECKTMPSCWRQYSTDWMFKVPAKLKSCKSIGRCLCNEFRGTVIEVELEIPLDPAEDL
ncbi:hypothetical protein ACFQDN_21755 [Pseudomonas asuensis]|uniref:Uncharacterized protein n=1 Tax=Pseudomonas asuensis TaxID=1825787 RepID=A0ABQ2H3D3_9PSED|nr:hypothetical protein [Pseudomonas asuensis]GGM25148.1 hypothetical protein GCM10009425_39970 [Pseudomonas asuensis]